MENFTEHFLGKHDLIFHIAGFVFCLFGAIVGKFHFWRKHYAQEKAIGNKLEFNLKYWFKHNWVDVLVSLIASFIFVRFLDIFLHWLNPKLKVLVDWELPYTEDQIFYYFIIGLAIQILMHRMYKNIDKKTK